MTPRNAVHLHPWRHAQLRAIADHLGIEHVTDLLDAWIVREADALGIGTDPEGFEIVGTRDADGEIVAAGAPLVIVGGDLLPQIHMHPAEARELADKIDGTLEAGITAQVNLTIDGDEIEFARKGRGYVLRIVEPEFATGRPTQRHNRGLTAGLARDLARALRKAADKAEA